MPGKIDQEVRKEQQQRDKIRLQAEQKGKKQHKIKQQEANINRGGLTANRPLAILNPLTLVRLLIERVVDLARYGSWPYALLALIGWRTIKQEQERAARLSRRHDWQTLIDQGLSTPERQKNK